MRSKKIKAILCTIVFCLIGLMSFLVIHEVLKDQSKNDLINISKLSDKFMNNYYDEMQKIDNNNKDNMLIVTSKKKLVNDFGATSIIEGPNNQYFLLFENGSDKEKAYLRLKKNEDVINVDKNNVYKFSEVKSSKYNSWGVEKSGFDYINNILETSFSNKLNEVNVAIIDTGCNMDVFNQQFEGKIVESYNIFEQSNEMYDNFGHGTHIAGTIAESTPSNVKIVPLKVSDSMSLYDSDIILAVNYIVDNKIADVINMSFGSSYYNDSLYVAIDAAREQNIISVAAAGNEGMAVSNYPAINDNTISISAVDSDLNLAEFSNFGEGLNFSAPGVNIKSLASIPEDEIQSGTSMATPHAVSAIAILKSLEKNLSLEDVIDLLKTHAIDLGPKGYDKYFGDGFINFSSVQLCEDEKSQSCDEHGVFRKIIPNRINVSKVVLTNYNYGSINNILASELTIYSEDGTEIIKPFYEIDDIKISGYDPFLKNEQEVKVNYLDYETTFKVINPANYELGWEYENDYSSQDSIRLTKYKDSNTNINKLYFPNVLNGKKVIAIAESHDVNSRLFNGSQDMKKFIEVSLPENITKIGGNAFDGFDKLYKVSSDAKTLYIGHNAFRGLPYLTYFDAVVTLDEYSFGAFAEDLLLKEITLSEDTTIIPEFAFMGCSSLTDIGLSENIKVIETRAFMSSGLEKINIPGSVTTIDSYAFFDTKFENVHIPASVISIGEASFGNPNLKRITVSENNKNYDSRNNSNAIIETDTNKLIVGAVETNIPNTVVTIGSYAFMNSSISILHIPEGVTTIEQDAFVSAPLLEEVYLPKSLNSIPSDTFNYGYYSRYHSTALMVYENSYAHQFALEEDATYKIVDKEYVDNRIFYYDNVWIIRIEYNANEQVSKDDVSSVEIYYENTNESEILDKEDFWIEYENGGDRLLYGDYVYYVCFNLKNGINNIKVPVPITINKPIPEFEVPTGLTGRLGQKLSEISLPENFSWMDGSIMLTKLGEQTFKAKYELDENYQIVENIDVVINVNGKSIIEPKISIDNKVYDGTTELDIKSIKIENLKSDEYTITKVESFETNVGVRNATIKLKLSDDKFKYFAFDGEVQEKEFNVNFNIIPKQIDIQYKSSGKTVKYDGKYHSIDIDIESLQNVNIKYMDENFNYTLDEIPKYKDVGEYVIKFRIYIDENHTDIYGEEILKILNDSIINNTQDCETIYDGKYHSLNIDIDIDSYEVKYSLDNKNYNLNTSPKFIGVGEYTVYYKIISKNYDDYYGSNKVKIYGIKSFDNTITIRDNILILKNNSFSNLKTKFNIYAKSILYNHLENNGLLVNSDNLITGDILEITLNNSTKYNYKLSILGDVNADGKISSADYVKIKKHIMQSEIINNNIYFYSADINNDNKISSSDYVKIRKYIMNGESL